MILKTEKSLKSFNNKLNLGLAFTIAKFYNSQLSFGTIYLLFP